MNKEEIMNDHGFVRNDRQIKEYSYINEYEIKDSGERREMLTGAVRDVKKGKGSFDLLPPKTIWDLARHFQKGAEKYKARNWELGISISEFIDSGLRHALEFMMGFEDENHLIAAIWNLVCCYETLYRIKLGLLPKELNDLPYPYKGFENA